MENNKLNEFRDYYTQIQDSAVQQSAFKEGFNMALDLNLTKEFIKWTFSEEGLKYTEKSQNKYDDLSEEEAFKKFMEDTYDYWIENIFEPIYK